MRSINCILSTTKPLYYRRNYEENFEGESHRLGENIHISIMSCCIYHIFVEFVGNNGNPDKGLISRIHKKLLQLNKSTCSPIKYGQNT